jgi:hypothetical protein
MNQTLNTPLPEAPAGDDPPALIEAIRLSGKHKKLIARVTLLFTAGGG